MIEKIFKPAKISKENFAKYGDIISTNNLEPIDINNGYAKRFNNLANINTSKDQGKKKTDRTERAERTERAQRARKQKRPQKVIIR